VPVFGVGPLRLPLLGGAYIRLVPRPVVALAASRSRRRQGQWTYMRTRTTSTSPSRSRACVAAVVGNPLAVRPPRPHAETRRQFGVEQCAYVAGHGIRPPVRLRPVHVLSLAAIPDRSRAASSSGARFDWQVSVGRLTFGRCTSLMVACSNVIGRGFPTTHFRVNSIISHHQSGTSDDETAATRLGSSTADRGDCSSAGGATDVGAPSSQSVSLTVALGRRPGDRVNAAAW